MQILYEFIIWIQFGCFLSSLIQKNSSRCHLIGLVFYVFFILHVSILIHYLETHSNNTMHVLNNSSFVKILFIDLFDSDLASVLDLIGGGSRSTTPISMHSRKSPTAELGIQVNKKKVNATSSVVVPSIVVGAGNSSSYNNIKEVGGPVAVVVANNVGGGGNASNTTSSKRNNNQNHRRESVQKREELAANIGGDTDTVATEAAIKADKEANGIRVNFSKSFLSIATKFSGWYMRLCEMNAQSHDWIRWLAANTPDYVLFF